MVHRILWKTVLASALASPVWCAEIVVTKLADDGPGSLRDAVNQANAADDKDTIKFDFSALPGGGQRVINLTSGPLVINRNVMIMGPGPKDLVVQRSTDEGTPEFRIFAVNFGDKMVTISGMTIRNGDGGAITGGGALSTGAGNKVELHDTVVENNTAAAPQNATGGGAIFNACELTITASQFSGNSVTMPGENKTAGGGAIFNAGTLSVDKSSFSGNMATDGSGDQFHFGGAVFNENGGTVTITNSGFDGNQVSGFGGAIFNNVGGTVTITNSTVSGNGALDGGGVMNLGTIDQLNSNIINGNLNNPLAGGTLPDLGLGAVNGTINSASGNNIGHTNGHGLDPATNQLGVDPNLEPLRDNGGPTPTRKPDPDNSPAKDQGDDSLGLRFDHRGFFRTVGNGTDIGGVETGNRVLIATAAEPAAWPDSANWLDGKVPGAGDPAWIVGGRTADLTGSVSIDVDSINVGVSGDVGGADGTVIGSDNTITTNSIDVGSAYGQNSPLNSGNGDISLTNATVSSANLLSGVSESTGEGVYTTSNASISLTSNAGGTSTLSVAGNAGVGAAAAFAMDSKAFVEGFFQFDGQSATFGALFAGQSLASDGGRATSSAQVVITASENVDAGSLTAATALSGPDSITVTEQSNISLTADRVAVNGPVTFAQAQISGPANSAPGAEVSDAWYAVTAREHSIAGRMSLGSISASTFGTAAMEIPKAKIGTVGADVRADSLSINSGLDVAPIFATGVSDNTIDDVRLTITESDTEVSGVVAVGSMFLSNAASGVINNAVLEVIGGTFRIANTPAGFPSLRIGTIDAFTPAGLAQTTATARFDGVVADIAGTVAVANTNLAGANSASSTEGTLELKNSKMTVGGDILLAEQSGLAIIASALAKVRLNPSLLSIGGNLRMGEGAVLDFLIEGLERPTLELPGEYGAIDAGGADLDGRLMVDFAFPAVAEGDLFELIRLEPGGLFTGDFDSFSATGLPVGLGIQSLFSGDSFFVEVISAPSMLEGDTNADGLVNIDDLNAVCNNFGTMGDPDGTLDGDAFPFDGQVNIDDLNAVRNNFGAMAAAVPEPSTCVLFCLCALFSLIAPRRR